VPVTCVGFDILDIFHSLHQFELMKFNILNRNSYQSEDIQNEWNKKGRQYAIEINEMVEFGESNGWENWSQ